MLLTVRFTFYSTMATTVTTKVRNENFGYNSLIVEFVVCVVIFSCFWNIVMIYCEYVYNYIDLRSDNSCTMQERLVTFTLIEETKRR